jgi:hypothetical protein
MIDTANTSSLVPTEAAALTGQAVTVDGGLVMR